MENFKIYDYVVITKSTKNWSSFMDKFDKKIVKITKISGEEHKDSIRIYFNEGEEWSWIYSDNHFRKALSYEIPNSNKIVNNFKYY